MLAYRHNFANQVSDQISVFEQLISNSVELSFHYSDSYPSQEEIQNILSLADKSIQFSNNNEIFIEIQLILFLTVIHGIRLNQALTLNQRDWSNLENIKYQGQSLTVKSKNRYCNSLVSKINQIRKNDGTLFKVFNRSNTLQFLNLFLIMNGYEYVLTENNLVTIFGRFLYLRHGRIRSIREFLKKYFKCDSHIDLLVELKLVDTVFYNTMMRN